MKLKLLFGIYLCCILKVVFFSSVILASSSRLERNVDQNQVMRNISRNLSVLEMLTLEILLKRSVGDTKQTQALLTQIYSIWPKIVNMSISLYDKNFPNEYNNQLEIKNHFARILFIARVRHCKSPDETFYQPMNRCLPINSEQPCPANMTLNDGPDNLGFCDCSYSKFIYSKQTRRCYAQNSQGPCQKGNWFVLVNGNPVCRPVPRGCPADGEHVFWSPNASMTKKCWKIRTRGPCSSNKILIGFGDSDVSCQENVFPAALSPAPLRVFTKCDPGSYKKQNQKCQPSFF